MKIKHLKINRWEPRIAFWCKCFSLEQNKEFL